MRFSLSREQAAKPGHAYGGSGFRMSVYLRVGRKSADRPIRVSGRRIGRKDSKKDKGYCVANRINAAVAT